jgi:membrane protein YdbS with pleckstrin-like domain
VIGGEEQVVLNTNTAAAPAVNGAIVFYLVLMAIVALFIIRAVKLRYYLYQEKLYLTKN